MSENTHPILVTGGSGFIAGHCIIALLGGGNHVRTTVRSLSRENEVRANLEKAGATNLERLEFVEADLMADGGWAQAVTDGARSMIDRGLAG